MLQDMSRATVLQIWFAMVAVFVAAGVAFGPSVTAGTLAVVLALCLVPPAIVLLMWPGVQPPTAAEVLRGDRTV